jgi:hypothetical protein
MKNYFNVFLIQLFFVASDMDMWQALANTVINVQVPSNVRNLTS